MRSASIVRLERIKPTWLWCNAASMLLSIDSRNSDCLSGREGLFTFDVSLMLRVSDPACLEEGGYLIGVVSLTEDSGPTTDPGVNQL